MNSDIVSEIVELAQSLAKLQAGGKVEQGVTYAGILLQIFRKVSQAYREHTGEKLDPSLIKAEGPV